MKMTRFVFATLGANLLRIGDCCNIFIFVVEDQKYVKENMNIHDWRIIESR